MGTIKEIAELAGVSSVTVSAVLRGKSSVRESSRQRVLEAIRKHNLRHPAVTRTLMGYFSKMVGMVVPDINNPIYTEAIVGATEVLRTAGYHLLHQVSDLTLAEEDGAIFAELQRYELSGFIVAAMQENEDHSYLRQIMDSGKALVTIGPVPGLETHTIDFEDRRGSRLATEYLIERGHREIVHLMGPATWTSAKERLLGFMEGLVNKNLPYRESMHVEAASWQGGYEAALDVLSNRTPRPTALLCYNDLVAFGVYRAAHELGLRVPDDVSVAGFDDIQMASIVSPSLTTVSIFPFNLGRQCAEVLLQVINGENKGRFLKRMIRVELMERGSVASVPV